jgi:hypothetical protein
MATQSLPLVILGLAFLSSPLLNANDGTTSREWGPQTRGVAVYLSIDKDKYALGEDIPLHTAVQNYSARVPIYSVGLDCCDLKSIVVVDVRDAEGRAIARKPLGESVCEATACPALELGLHRYQRRTVVPQERTLAKEGLLPDHPGRFSVSATWTVYSCEHCDHPFAVAHSLRRVFEVATDPAPHFDSGRKEATR